ncbi:hypothetical protein CXB51_008991 [Gossypium anomalum]|uniref:COMM domain-containing protein n=1 Tax=Gossypium anomalum TaxID=47600 RepID=A0A8J5YZ20_9ROSI|nr:hypothetical protein CXB51_008991 [Gossypium anomalum]
MERTLWGHLPLLVRANSKESVEYILQTLWRTRKTGLDADDRRLICQMLQLQNESDLDPVIIHSLTQMLIVVSKDYSIWFLLNILFYFPIAVVISLLVCLRMLMRKCVYENISKDDIQKLFPSEVLPELQRLLTLLLQKFQREWRADVHMDKVSLPRLKTMTWNLATQDSEVREPVAIINLKLQNDMQCPQESDLSFQLAKETLDTMLKSVYSIRDQLSNMGET